MDFVVATSPIMRLDKLKPTDKILLIFDLDETLIHATDDRLDRDADFIVYDYHVYKRPGLDAFLSFCHDHFYVAVWSSASDLYVQAVVKQIFPDPEKLEFVWGRSRATFRRFRTYSDEAHYYDPTHMHYIKPLSKVRKQGWSLKKMLIVDDTPEKCIRNYGNAIYPLEYDGNAQDNELEQLTIYLRSLQHKENVRAIEKRHWRQQVQ